MYFSNKIKLLIFYFCIAFILALFAVALRAMMPGSSHYRTQFGCKDSFMRTIPDQLSNDWYYFICHSACRMCCLRNLRPAKSAARKFCSLHELIAFILIGKVLLPAKSAARKIRGPQILQPAPTQCLYWFWDLARRVTAKLQSRWAFTYTTLGSK